MTIYYPFQSVVFANLEAEFLLEIKGIRQQMVKILVLLTKSTRLQA